MLLVRELLYKEKTLDEFDIESSNSIFEPFYEVLLTMEGTQVTDLDVEKNITSMFNDVFYICTIALLMKRPELQLGYFITLCNRKGVIKPHSILGKSRADEVMSMVYCLLFFEGNRNTNSFMRAIEKHMKRSLESSMIFKSFYDATCYDFYGFPDNYFKTCEITKELLDNSNLNWRHITNDYDKNKLKELVCYWTEPHQRNLIIDDIEREVRCAVFDEDLPF